MTHDTGNEEYVSGIRGVETVLELEGALDGSGGELTQGNLRRSANRNGRVR